MRYEKFSNFYICNFIMASEKHQQQQQENSGGVMGSISSK